MQFRFHVARFVWMSSTRTLCIHFECTYLRVCVFVCVCVFFMPIPNVLRIYMDNISETTIKQV
jgi:hypothetical protein